MARRRVTTGVLYTASALLPVGVAVPANQILNDGIWSWWWTLIAFAMSAVSITVGYFLNRRAMPNQPSSSDPGTSQASDPPPPPPQTIKKSSAGGINQVGPVGGDANINNPAQATSPPGALPPSSPPDPTRQPDTPQSGQHIDRVRTTGNINQIRSVDRNLEIDGR